MTALQLPALPRVAPTPLNEPSPDALPDAGAERRMTFAGIRWETYVSLCDDVGPGTRITYDRGRMEVVMPSELPGDVKVLLARLAEAYADATNVPWEGMGSWTLRREDLARGLEADACYYVSNVPARLAVRRAGRRLDLTRDPPPDLAIEVDISPPEIAKPPIYAALGVPEVWRCDGQVVRFLIRTSDGRYAEAERSAAFPNLAGSLLAEMIAIGLREGHSDAVALLKRRLTDDQRPR